jgi:hypothetical protein
MLVAPATARAFHAGAVFDKPASAGGGGGIFYVGAPRDRVWDCSACHVDAPGTIRLDLTSVPAALFTDRRYVPGQAYVITAKLIGEHEGLASPQANYNSFAIAAVDDKGDPTGRFSGYASDDFYDGGVALVDSGKKVGLTTWTLTWTAPPAGRGRVNFHVALVDGNGANSPSGVTLTDPFGDDLVIGSVGVDEASVAFREPLLRALDTDRMLRHEATNAQLATRRRLLGHQRLRARDRRRQIRARPANARGSDDAGRSLRRRPPSGHLSSREQSDESRRHVGPVCRPRVGSG